MTAAFALRPLPQRFTLFRESRRETRYAARLPVTWVHADGARHLWTREVSFSGLAVESEEPLQVRHLIRCQITLPTTGERFEFHAMTVHQLDGGSLDGAPPVFGLMLYALDRDARAVWGRMVQHVRDHGDAAP